MTAEQLLCIIHISEICHTWQDRGQQDLAHVACMFIVCVFPQDFQATTLLQLFVAGAQPLAVGMIPKPTPSQPITSTTHAWMQQT